MKICMLTDEDATRTLIVLVRDCIRFDFAVAWATANPLVEAMLETSHKLGKVVIGTHMYQTDPEILRAFMPYSETRCLPPNGRLFHPKVYIFETTNGLSIVVGSHNLTGGAFGGGNIEISVLLEGDTDDPALRDIVRFVGSSWDSSKKINDDHFLFAYEVQYRLHKSKRDALSIFHDLKKPRTSMKISPMVLTWAKFVEGVKGDAHHSVDGRLAILEQAAILFSNNSSFSAMLNDERRAIAGTFGPKEQQLGGLHWLWFGSMFGQGDFKNLVNQSPKYLSAALDHIPTDGDISEDQFDIFVQEFEKAFRGKSHKGGIATASRLLAMKRPDFFVGVNDANRLGICGAFGSAPTTLNVSNYWERIVVPMQNSPWWLAPRPRGALNARIWDNRAALLDSIYYTPKIKKKATA